MYIYNVNFFNVKPSILKIMEKEEHELEVVHGIEKVNSNTLSHVKGGISDPAEETTLQGVPEILDRIKDIDRKKIFIHFERV